MKTRRPAAPKNTEPDEEISPEVAPVESDDCSSVYDSEDVLERDSDDSIDDDGYETNSGEDDFEDQGSSDDDEERLQEQIYAEESDDDVLLAYESQTRSWSPDGKKRLQNGSAKEDPKIAQFVHVDDLSSDEEDEDGKGNRIGRVPLHWYDDLEHIGYDGYGQKVAKSASIANGDRIEQALANQDSVSRGKYVVFDVLNDRNVELTDRQLELIRRVQGGAYAHPEHDAHPDYIDYFSGINPIISGLNSNRHEPKSRFQPSKWEKLQVDRLLDRFEKGYVSMDYLTGKIHDMKDAKGKSDPNKPFALWSGSEEDELNMRKGPHHIAAPKLPPPGHASSYIPPDEFLPTESDLKSWEELPTKERPHGHLIPKKFPNLRSVGAYQHSVREAFERCLDLYLCPRVLKRRLNIDPESLVPRLPRAQDLKPFPNTTCIQYLTPYKADDGPPTIRCISSSPDGQFMASGASDGCVRLWEVRTGRLLRSWNIASIAKNLDVKDTEEDLQSLVLPVVCIEWNPNRSHHCLLAAVGKYIFILAAGTAGENDVECSRKLLESALQGGNVKESSRASKAVNWISLEVHQTGESTISATDNFIGPICALRTNHQVSCLRWQIKGDYFASVCPKAGAAAVLIHQLSKGDTQQPFSKINGETQHVCFHPNQPFLYVASQQHVRIYHLVKQAMVKRLVSGCRWISCLDVHPSGDHLIVGSLDRRIVWFDLDLSATPYKTLKYHERAARSCRFHSRYPLMASASDDGTVHVFHSMVYNDLMRNPLIVPVKILRGHTITSKLGVLTLDFHPTQPWIFTGGADGKIILFQDI